MQLDPWVLRWHGQFGVLASIFVIILIVTGIALNHTERLQLDAKFVDSGWLLDWYGISADASPVSFKVGETWVTEVDGRLFLDSVPIPVFTGALVGATQGESSILVGAPGALYLFDDDAQLIEKVGQVPGIIMRVGRLDEAYCIDSSEGVFSSKDGLLTWDRTDREPVWAVALEPPAKVMGSVLRAFRGQGLPWERVMLDLHSGRFFGSWGPYVMDAAAVILFLLVASGIYNWYARR